LNPTGHGTIEVHGRAAVLSRAGAIAIDEILGDNVEVELHLLEVLDSLVTAGWSHWKAQDWASAGDVATQVVETAASAAVVGIGAAALSYIIDDIKDIALNISNAKLNVGR